ncbi:hypothetical protein [Accumulibacter sp.]|uniref:hypothetical protein n=1 Tax=Accumulibacter sp. TaxID=2053492 RepID=UPI00260627C0|nr:hypothetical protein [Accumulibacter sp.]
MPVAGRQQMLTILNAVVDSGVPWPATPGQNSRTLAGQPKAGRCKLARGVAGRQPDIHLYPTALADNE